jgi:glycosyltransferase involved in cell wall biosynthesis
MKLLSVITSLNPALGGPVECAIQLQRNLARLGHSLDIVTLDRPSSIWNKSLSFQPICLGGCGHDNSRIHLRLIEFLRNSQRAYDSTIFHGIWTFSNVAIRVSWNRHHPYVVFAHGMLNPYFIEHFPLKHIKKSLYYRLIAAPVLKRAHAVLFTCEEERRLAATGYRPVVGQRIVVRYGINPPSFDARQGHNPFERLTRKREGKQLVLYIGRLHPTKGCDLLIESMGRLASSFPALQVVMAGPGEKAYVETLKTLAKRCGVSDRITWLGPVYRDDKWYLYNLADVFILPSHLENFGMTVAESLSQGLPVLLSDKVNIFPSIVRAGAGFAAPDTADGTTSLLQRWLSTSEQQRSIMRANCLHLFQDEFQAIHTAEDVIRIFQQNQVRSN